MNTMPESSNEFDPSLYCGGIFDMDGTLIDSMPFWEGTAERYLHSLGITPRPGFADVIRPMNFTQSTEYLIREYALRKTQEELIGEINLMIADFYRNQVLAKPGAVEFVQNLHEAGFPMKVLTATDHDIALVALKRVGILSCFQEVISCAVGKGKDSPESFLNAAASFRCVPGNVVVFDDALYAVRCAKQAGFTVIALHDNAASDTEKEIRSIVDAYWNRF